MSFVKLDTGILNSTLWVEREPRDMFITALLMAEPFETEQPMEQLEVHTLKATGFVVPPGWYGLVRAAGVGICRMAMVDTKEGLTALEKLGSPDPESRSKDFEGRRLVRVDGGFIILNYMKYRERDYTSAARAKRYRERVASRRDVTASRRNITQAEAEADKNKTSPPDGGSSVWDFGKSLLCEQGLSQSAAGGLIGSWLREWPEPVVAEAIRSAAGKADAKAYVAAILKTKTKKGVKNEPKFVI